MARSRKRKGPFPITSKFNLENFPFQRSIRTRAPTKRVTGKEAFLRWLRDSCWNRIYIYTSLRNRPILVYGVRYWITLLSSGNCKNQVMGYLGHLCRAGKVRGRVRVPVLSLSLFPGFGNLLRQNFRFPFPIEKHLSTLSYPCLRVFRTYIRFMKTENKGYAKLYIRIYIYIYVDSDIDGFWMETDGSMERPTKGQHVPRLSIRECKWSARFANYAWQVIKSTV